MFGLALRVEPVAEEVALARRDRAHSRISAEPLTKATPVFV
jgi:hypothetical protein